jgi:hypothetical protein
MSSKLRLNTETVYPAEMKGVHLSALPTPTHAVRLPAQPIEVYDPAWAPTPGISNLLWTPIDFFYTVGAWLKAKAIGDEDGELDARIRLSSMPFSFLHAICYTLTYLMELSYLFHPSVEQMLAPIIAVIGVPMLGLGIALCVVGGIYEGLCLGRILEITKQMRTGDLSAINEILHDPKNKDLIDEWIEDTPIESLPPEARAAYAYIRDHGANEEALNQIKDACLIENLSYFEANYLTITPEERGHIQGIVKRNFAHLETDLQNLERDKLIDELSTVKHAQLARRLRPWCATRISTELNGYLQVLRNPSLSPEQKARAREGAENLLNSIDIQAKKKMIIHIVGITALILSAIGFILILVACPALAPLVLLSIASGLSTLGYLYGKGALDQEGWSFSFCEAFPAIGWFYNKFYGSSCEECDDVELADVSSPGPQADQPKFVPYRDEFGTIYV